MRVSSYVKVESEIEVSSCPEDDKVYLKVTKRTFDDCGNTAKKYTPVVKWVEVKEGESYGCPCVSKRDFDSMKFDSYTISSLFLAFEEGPK